MKAINSFLKVVTKGLEKKGKKNLTDEEWWILRRAKELLEENSYGK